jgi:hypothetical protein
MYDAHYSIATGRIEKSFMDKTSSHVFFAQTVLE